jgi:hypothetical protein
VRQARGSYPVHRGFLRSHPLPDPDDGSPSAVRTALQSATHRSQIKALCPAISFLTCCSDLSQKEQWFWPSRRSMTELYTGYPVRQRTRRSRTVRQGPFRADYAFRPLATFEKTLLVC